MSLLKYRLHPRHYRPRTILGAPVGHLDHVTRLSRHWLWLGGWLSATVGERVCCRVDTSTGTVEQEGIALSFRRRDVEWHTEAQGLVVLLDAGPLEEVLRVWLALERGWFRWSGRRAPALSRRLGPKQENELTFMAASAEQLRDRLSRTGLSKQLGRLAAEDEIFAGNRLQLDFLFAGVGVGLDDGKKRDGVEVQRSLEPPFSTSLDGPFGYGIDQCLALDDRHVFIRGWIWDPTESVTDLSLVCDAGRADGLPSLLGFQARPDVVDHVRGAFPSLGHLARGFAGMIALPFSNPSGAYHLEFRLVDRTILAVGPPIAPTDPATLRHEVVRSVEAPPGLDSAFVGGHLRPALARLEKRIPAAVAREDQHFGEPVASPVASLIFVCGSEARWIEERLMLTLRAPACREAEVILLATAPEEVGHLARAAHAVERLTGLHLRLVTPNRALSAAEAINLGCRLARSERLVLLSDDVFAVDASWLQAMLDVLETTVSAKAVGALLSTEDGGIRDFGVDVEDEAGAAAASLRIKPRYRGWPPQLAGAFDSMPVPAKSSLGLLTTRESFESVSGFDESYVHRDIAAYDFCRRLETLGRDSVWHCGSARLEQVTRNEPMAELDGWLPNAKTRFLDRWLLTQRWKTVTGESGGPARSPELRREPLPLDRPGSERKLRIVHVIGGYLPEATAGTQLQLRELCREQIARGHRPSIFTRVERLDAKHLSCTEDEWERVPVTRLNNTFEDCDSFERIYTHPKIDALFKSHLEQEEPDVVHVHHLSCLSTSMVEVASDLGIPVVMWLSDFWLVCLRGQRFHPRESTVCLELNRARCLDCLAGLLPGLADGRDVPWEERLRERDAGIEKLRAWDRHVQRILGRCDMLLVPSEAQRQRFLEIGVDSRKCGVVEYGLPKKELRRTPRGDAPIRSIGYLGSVIPSKGVHVLVEAFRRLDDPGLRLEIHGEIVPFHEKTDYLSDLEALAADDERIRFHGRYEASELSRLLEGIDLLVVPSLWWESYCLTAREGALAGLPVVTFPFAGLGEAVASGLAIGATPVSVAGLTRTLERVLADAALRDRASRQGDQVRDSADAAAEIETIYHDVIGVPALRAVP